MFPPSFSEVTYLVFIKGQFHVFLFKVVLTNIVIFLCSSPIGNTVSNLIMIIPPIFGAIQSVRDGLEKRYIASYLALTGMCNTSSKDDVQYSDGLFFSFIPRVGS